MCEQGEIHWPACDPAPMDSVDSKHCIIIKAKKEYEREMCCLVKNFSDSYSRALALFYSQEAEQKARKQYEILRGYITQLQDYQKRLKAGVPNLQRPKAPREIYPQDPFDRKYDSDSDLISETSETVDDLSSLDFEFMEQRGILSSQTVVQLEMEGIVKNRRKTDLYCEPSSNVEMVPISRACCSHGQNKALNCSKNKFLHTKGANVVATDSKSDVERQISKPISSVNDSSSSSEYQSVGEQRSSRMSRKSNNSCKGNDSSEKSSDQPAEATAIAINETHQTDSVTSLATNFTGITDYSDYDHAITKLEKHLQKLDKNLKEKNHELLSVLESRGIKIPDPRQNDMALLTAHEEQLSYQIDELRAKLTQLDQASSAPIQLKEFCRGLKTAMDQSSAAHLVENFLGHSNTDVSAPPADGTKTVRDRLMEKLANERKNHENHPFFRNFERSSDQKE